MASNQQYLLSLVILFCSWMVVCYSQDQALGGILGSDNSVPCIQNLVPCQAYMKSTATPPPSCCVPLKQTFKENSACLCIILKNPQILKSLNMTADQAMATPRACGVDVSMSVCKKDASAPTSLPASDTNDTSTPSIISDSSNAVYGISHFGVSCFATFFVALTISAFQA